MGLKSQYMGGAEVGGTCWRNKEMNKEGGNKMCIDQISVFLVRIHQYPKLLLLLCVC